MRDLTKLVLKSGLIDKATATLMERWGQLEPGAADLVDEQRLTGRLENTARSGSDKVFVQKVLEDFVEDLEILLQPEALERGVVQLDRPSVCPNCGGPEGHHMLHCES